ncbi:MAG: HesA/MoeB/ThiF family protein [Sandaracinaceae bacterium]|nr:HesA/MoeB/ThiF family protein [Sandaracinaceae bacterium]
MKLDAEAIRRARVLFVGAGGLSSPAALAIARTGVASITLLDDDLVDISNLHRQLLFSDADVGLDKATRAAARLQVEVESLGLGTVVRAFSRRLVPETAADELHDIDMVIEGADNMATKFLVADACALARVPVVQAGVIRWNGWAFANTPAKSACLRCVFEDLPSRTSGVQETCSVAGVVGPVVGVMGSIQALLAVRMLGGDTTAAGEIWSYDALRGSLRRSQVHRRAGCPLCNGEIRDLSVARYAAAVCAA